MCLKSSDYFAHIDMLKSVEPMSGVMLNKHSSPNWLSGSGARLYGGL